MYQFTNYVSNNNKNNNNNNKIKNEIIKSQFYNETNIINFLIKGLIKQLEFFKNDENKLKHKVVYEFLSDEKKIKIPIHLNNLKPKIKVLENVLIQLNRRKHNQIFESTGRHILNDDSIILNTLQFYENVLNENNISSLFLDEMSYTYSIEKDVALLTIDRIIHDYDPGVFQLSFIIFNFKNDSLMKTGIIQADVTNINNQNEFIIKYIDIKGKIKEAEKKVYTNLFLSLKIQS
jgi:hypothetical protein